MLNTMAHVSVVVTLMLSIGMEGRPLMSLVVEFMLMVFMMLVLVTHVVVRVMLMGHV